MANSIINRNIYFPLQRLNKLTRSFSSSSVLINKKVPEEAIPKNIIEKYIGYHQQRNGEIYDKRPFKMVLKANKLYEWCTCGKSKSQPLCDGTHRIHTLKIKHKPLPFMVEETKEYWLCNCKQSEHKPFCDGTHKNENIQSALKYYKF